MNKHIAWSWIVLFFSLCCPKLLQGQTTYGNEWIDYNQQYLRLKAGENGIYKVTYQQLQQAGFPVSQINPRSLQLFHRGQEQAILVQGESDEELNTEDYLLFYGRKNDGTQDRALYHTPELQPHNYYNLYSDTTAYYLTFSSAGTTGKRMQRAGGANTGGLSPQPYYWHEKLMVFGESFSGGTVYGFAGGGLDTYISYGDEGEGWFGPIVTNGASRNFTFSQLTHLYTAGPTPQLKMQLVGRNNLERSIPVKVGPTSTALTTLTTANFAGYRLYNIEENLPWSAIGADQAVVNISAASPQRVSATYVRLRVPRLWRMDGQAEQEFRLPASANTRYVEIENVATGAALYDLSDPHNPIRIDYVPEGSKIKALLPASGAREQVLLLSNVEKSVAFSRPITFRQLPSHGVPYIIISNQRLMQPAGGHANPVQAYAAYRASEAGGGHETLLVEMQELFDQFSYGEYTSMAIRKFIQYASQEKLPAYIFLIGKSLTLDYKYYRAANWTSTYRDLVPTYGWPGADIPFVAQLNGSGDAPAIPIGRLAARTPEEVVAYLNKVIEDETITPKSLWLKRLVHLSGGSSTAQARQLRGYLSNYER
ncbi:MAG: hypothetical protein KY428_05250, partial [Bacteroidetes bacterium]|nr:hypothetical protein [Bacteroidota bacterium]